MKKKIKSQGRRGAEGDDGPAAPHESKPQIWFVTLAEREVKDSCSSGMFQSCNFGTSECPKVASALVRGIFELFDVFLPKEIIMRSKYSGAPNENIVQNH